MLSSKLALELIVGLGVLTPYLSLSAEAGGYLALDLPWMSGSGQPLGLRGCPSLYLQQQISVVDSKLIHAFIYSLISK
jgi:hypothetical protein